MNSILKYASLLMAAVMLISCLGQTGDGPDGGTNTQALLLSSDKNLIQAGEDVAVLTLTLDGTPVTEGVVFFDGNNNVLDIADFKFSTETPGEYSLWAAYGTMNSNTISITVVSTAIPETPADPSPESTDFKSRVLVAQFTGTGCPNCPAMMNRLHPILEDETKSDDVVWVACHSYNNDDPAYLPTGRFSDHFGGGFPSLNLDFAMKVLNYASYTSDTVWGFISEQNQSKKDVASGIAVNAKLVDGQVVAKVTVKAAATAEYRVGALLLEDGIKKTQSSATAEWMNTHDACIRYVDAGAQAYGYKLGTVEKGKTVDYLFVWNLGSIWEKATIESQAWDPFVEENLRMAVYVVTTKQDNGQSLTYVNNAVYANFNEETPFEYAK